MTNFILGVIVGSLFTSSIGMAGQFYNSSGSPKAPTGSIQQYDYFRQRQQYLDLNAMRRNQEEALRHERVNPCGK